MIDGCLEWQREGLGNAVAVRAATSTYFQQQDAFRRWIDECCVLDPVFALKTGILLAAFNRWARANGEDEVGGNAFAELIDRTDGLQRYRGHGGVRMIKGINLRTQSSHRPGFDDAPDYGEQGDDG